MPKTGGDFTAEQREAVANADTRWTARRVQGLAGAGALAGLPSFGVSLATIQKLRSEAAAERRLNGSTRGNWDELEHEAAETLRVALGEIQDEARETGKTDLTRMRTWAAAYKAMRANYGRELPSELKGKGKSGPEKGQTTSLLQRLSTNTNTDESDSDDSATETDEDEGQRAA